MRTVFIFLLTLFSAAAFAQTTPTQKIGYADWEYIFSQMPEAKTIDNELKTHTDQLKAQLDAKYKEYEAKLKAYQAGAATMLETVRRDKETELTQIQESMQKFQQDAQTSIQKKQTTLLAPIYTKVGKAIEETAKENGYAFIFSPQMAGGGDILLYSDDKYDVSVLVLKKMGITPAPATTATTPKQ